MALADRRRIERGEVRIVAVEEHVVLHARAELGHGRAVEAVLGDGGKEPIFVGRTGPVGDGDRVERLRVDDAGIVRYQTAPGSPAATATTSCFPSAGTSPARAFAAVTDEPPTGVRLRATATAPSGLGGQPLGLFRFTAASSDATRRAARRSAGGAARARGRRAGDGVARGLRRRGARRVGDGARAQAPARRRLRALEIVPGKDGAEGAGADPRAVVGSAVHRRALAGRRSG